jgi:hypothetical protein
MGHTTRLMMMTPSLEVFQKRCPQGSWGPGSLNAISCFEPGPQGRGITGIFGNTW